MFLKLNKLCCISIIIFCFFLKNSFAEIVKKIEIIGNDRVSSETILMFASVKEEQNLSIQDLNDITIKLYDTNFFENIDVSLNNQKLTIKLLRILLLAILNLKVSNLNHCWQKLTNN